jgi:nucleoside 2-deoxyribosyltransferase
MERRYQVFVSSTYEDLEDERREVIQALLSMGCFPAGMELFPAADDDQWTLIEKEIDQSDYYLVISAGKYGSVHPAENKSFTQMEYEYAVSKGKPVIAFLHRDLGKLPLEKTERQEDRRLQLEAFRQLAKTRLCKMWDSCDSLAKAVYQSVHHVMQEKPSAGWVRATGVYDESEMLTLQNRSLQLQNELQPLRLAGLVGGGTSPYTIEWGTLFSKAKKLDVLFAYGRTWRYSRLVELTEFVCTAGNRVRVILPDPGR